MKQWFLVITLGLLTTIMLGCSNDDEVRFEISSPSFEADGVLPDAYTCNGKAFGEGSAPGLSWTAGPEATLSYAIVFKDLSLAVDNDHSYHWMIWDIPASTRTLPEGLPGDQFPAAMNGAQQFSGGPDGGYAYLGPCPSWENFCSPDVAPVVDTYSFTLYAFDIATISLPAVNPDIENFVRQMDAHFISMAIAETQITITSGAIPTSVPFPCPGAAKAAL